MNIREAIDKIITGLSAKVPSEHSPASRDTVKSGDTSRELAGIITTFMATREVISNAPRLGANLIITHEPTFYHDGDDPGWLGDDRVCLSKKRELEENQLVIWRLHDQLHFRKPDGILAGMAQQLEWQSFAQADNDNLFRLPALTLEGLALEMKQKLGIARVKVAGNLDMVCSCAALLPGATRGERQIRLLRQAGVDVLICGESAEWETCEYVRDAEAAGERKGLIVLGHANSEEAGMKWLARWLQAHFSASIPIHHLTAGDPFHFV